MTHAESNISRLSGALPIVARYQTDALADLLPEKLLVLIVQVLAFGGLEVYWKDVFLPIHLKPSWLSLM